jgi:hypothetical protein
MAIEDYLPNIFGSVPSAYQGLLGTEETAALQKRSNIGGLLSAGAALAQGMSAQGPRRSALQNVLGALAAGYTGAGQAGVAGIEQMVNAQKFGQMQRQQEAMKMVLQDPKVVNDPAMKAWVLANPDKALEVFIKRRGLADFMTREGQPQQPTVPQAQPSLEQPQAEVSVAEGQLPGMVVTPPPPRPKPYENEIRQADTYAKYWASSEGDDPTKSKAFQDRATELRKLQYQSELITSAKETLAGVDPTLRSRADSLILNSPNMTQEQIQSRLDAILSDDAKLKETLDPRFAAQRLKEKRAGATVIDMGQRELEKQVAGDVAAQISTSAGQARSSVKTINTVKTLLPKVEAGVYEGTLSNAPRAIDQLSSALKVSGKNTQEKLARTAEVMQGLASLELDSAKLMAGQGSITQPERELIARAAGGNLKDFTSAEVASLLRALDKTARSKIESHQGLYEQIQTEPALKKYSKFYKIEMPAPIQGQQPTGGRSPEVQQVLDKYLPR